MKSLVPQFPLPGINTVVLGMVLHICFKSKYMHKYGMQSHTVLCFFIANTTDSFCVAVFRCVSPRPPPQDSRIELRALFLLGSHSTNELCPQSWMYLE